MDIFKAKESFGVIIKLLLCDLNVTNLSHKNNKFMYNRFFFNINENFVQLIIFPFNLIYLKYADWLSLISCAIYRTQDAPYH